MYIEVIVPVSMPNSALIYSYESKVEVGCRVRVAVGRGSGRNLTGIVAKVDVQVPDNLKYRIREIAEVIDAIPITTHTTIEFWKWLAAYYICPIGTMLRVHYAPMFSTAYEPRVSLKRNHHRVRFSVKLPELLPFKLDENAQTTLIHEVSPLDITSLVDELMAVDGHILILTPTSSKGKAVAKALSKWWHVEQYYSTNKLQSRGDCCVRMAFGLVCKIVVGTRTALSLPFNELGAVIVLDEHSTIYRSAYVPANVTRVPQYGARDAALYLASLHKAKAFLVSPVPSMETYFNALNSGWQLLQTPACETPELKSIVLERGKDMISKYLKTKIAQALKNNGKAIIFQNRRGYASWVECEGCGYTPSCKECNVALTYHSHSKELQCHYCGHREPFVPVCPDCGGEMTYFGRGTERIEEQIRELFPEANVVRIDSDSVKRSTSSFKLDRDWQIVIGTQLLLDHVLDWQGVEVVGVVNADNMTSAIDFRIQETAFRLLDLLGQNCRKIGAELVVQSAKTDNNLVKMALENDYLGFYNNEIKDREKTLYPPFVRLIKIELRSKIERNVYHAGMALEGTLRARFGNRLSPLFQPYVNKQSSDHIVQLLLKIERESSFAQAKEQLLLSATPVLRQYRKNVYVSYEVDPL